MPKTTPPVQDHIHTWFSLSYSNYLVLNRTLLQSMPDAWQAKFVELLDELERAFDHVEKAEGYEVTAGRWPYIEECTEAELKAAGITQCKEDTDTYHNANGDELTGTDYAFVPGRDPVPHYNRGRAYMEPKAETAPEDTCRVYEDDEGQLIRVQGGAPMDEQGQAAFKEIIGAAKRRFQREKAEEKAAIRADERAKVAEEIASTHWTGHDPERDRFVDEITRTIRGEQP